MAGQSRCFRPDATTAAEFSRRKKVLARDSPPSPDAICPRTAGSLLADRGVRLHPFAARNLRTRESCSRANNGARSVLALALTPTISRFNPDSSAISSASVRPRCGPRTGDRTPPESGSWGQPESRHRAVVLPWARASARVGRHRRTTRFAAPASKTAVRSICANHCRTSGTNRS